ncbi:MAG: 6-phosphofructokinase [Candidatus Margulisbacteria bacterium]|nr:6-phosphofructokinase [Candidatus Margulisiibacteriota bacterium]MBU1022531.1 6-phosphofructokinase [Candidatus Margulisiibacteriota bacterium]MBU1728817.1 6-phosphofructokinase [Candidatus Margulisiibacteriota bacterium]MBU1955783.1 6-phosphofructokinase [Candidatus Margulisiibacteriota bacterium]
MESIGVITTGGDAPGMNTAIRAVVRTGIYYGMRVFGIFRGWRGLVENHIFQMDLASVGNILNRGGTILHTARYPEFKQKRQKDIAMKNLKEKGIQGLVVIGGDGSLRASAALYNEYKLPIVNVPASIDNDIPGTDYTIGYDTAVNTAVEAIDKIRDTATSHERLFIVQVMGRGSGSIAIDVGLVSGAEGVIVPEYKFDLDKLAKSLLDGKKRGKRSFIIVVAEGAGSGQDIGEKLAHKTGLDVRVSVLGHMQRGGSPSALSREYACKLGCHAVELLKDGKGGRMVGIKSDHYTSTPIAKVLTMKKKIDTESYRISHILSI